MGTIELTKEEIVNVAPPQETSHEEFEVEMIGSTDEKTVEDVEPQIAEAQETIELTKEEIVEEPVEQQKEASLPCEEPHVAVAASLIEHVAQRIVPVGKVSVAPEELPSHQVQPVEEVNEPKTRSVKSSKPCSGGRLLLSHLNAHVTELIYWRDSRKSGVVFGSILAVLLSLSVVSFISVLSYGSLAVLAITLSFRLYIT